jgi:Ca-activated chloride channel family protein
MALTLSAAVDRPLVRTGASSERYLMLTLQTPAGVVQRLPLNLALVVDRSGSMAGQKLARAGEAAGFVLRHLTSVDRVAIVAYDDEVTVVAPSTPLTPQAKTDLLYRLSRIEAGGSTNLGGGWLTGCQEVAKHQVGDGQLNRALLLTDGLANVGITSVEELVEHARQLRLRGIVTSTMGVGADFNEELLEAMARHGGGRFQYVETAKHIPDCVQGELGEMLEVAARKVAVEVMLPEAVRCLGCLNEYVLEETPRGVRVHLGDLLAGDTRRILLKLSVSPGHIDRSLAIGALALYVDTATGHGSEQLSHSAELRYADPDAVDRQETNDEVARAVALLLAAQAKEEAARLSRRGADAAAASALAAAGQALSAGPFAADPAVAGEITVLASMAAEASSGLAEHQRKELRYQSYLTRESRRRYDPPRG